AAWPRSLPPPAHRHRPPRPQGPRHFLGAGPPRQRRRHPDQPRRGGRHRRAAAGGTGRLQRGDEAAAYEQGLGIGDWGFGSAFPNPESRIPDPGYPMGIQCGIVGLPNVGKSTLFYALTTAGIAAANFPFCTIEPNVGVVPVPDPRLAALSEIVKPERVVPTAVEFVDIAGLVAGAASGEGLGNKFLAHIRE